MTRLTASAGLRELAHQILIDFRDAVEFGLASHGIQVFDAMHDLVRHDPRVDVDSANSAAIGRETQLCKTVQIGVTP